MAGKMTANRNGRMTEHMVMIDVTNTPTIDKRTAKGVIKISPFKLTITYQFIWSTEPHNWVPIVVTAHARRGSQDVKATLWDMDHLPEWIAELVQEHAPELVIPEPVEA